MKILLIDDLTAYSKGNEYVIHINDNKVLAENINELEGLKKDNKYCFPLTSVEHEGQKYILKYSTEEGYKPIIRAKNYSKVLRLSLLERILDINPLEKFEDKVLLHPQNIFFKDLKTIKFMYRSNKLIPYSHNYTELEQYKLISMSMLSEFSFEKFKINKNYCQDSINSLAYIKGVEIERRLPSTIKIKVKEREEVAAIPYIGALVYIDEEGCILNIEEKSGEINLPQIFGLDLVNLKIGDFLFKGEEEKLDFLRIGKSNNTLKQMKYINFSSEENTMLELKNNIKVAFGPLDNVKYKLSFLNEILKDIDKKELKVKQILMNKGDNPILVVED